MRISAWSLDVCSSDLDAKQNGERRRAEARGGAQQLRVEPAQRRMDYDYHKGHRERRVRNDQPERAVDEAERRKEKIESDDKSEEHTSELQSLMRISYAVFCLKKKKKKTTKPTRLQQE